MPGVKERHSPLAGEMSGHIFFADRWFGFDDAIYASTRLLEIAAKSDLKVSQMLAHARKLVAARKGKLQVEAAREGLTVELPVSVRA